MSFFKYCLQGFLFLKQYFPRLFTGVSFSFMFLQLFYMYHLFVTDDVGGLSFEWVNLVWIAVSFFSISLGYYIILLLFFKSRFRIIIATLFYLSFFTLLVGYHFAAQQAFDFAVIIDNFWELFHEEVLGVIFFSLNVDVLLYGLFFGIVFLVAEFFWRFLSKNIAFVTDRFQRLFVAVSFYLILLFIPIDPFDPILAFLKSIRFYYRDVVLLHVDKVPSFEYKGLSHLPERYLDYQDLASDVKMNRPNVILFVIESLNADLIGKVAANGKEITPFLNQLANNSFYINPFFGNSIQTAKGHFSLFFSRIPSLQGKTFVRYKDANVQSIATVFKKHDYETLLFTAYDNMNFDNESDFLSKRGYDRYETVGPFLKDDDVLLRLKWGVRDSVFIDRFMDTYQDRFTQSKPFFVTLTSIANHFPFNTVPQSLKKMYPDSASFKEDYANSVHLVDQGVKRLFERLEEASLLENTIVIVTADHAYPMGLHQNYHLEAGYYNDSFAIPFFMVWKGQLSHEKVDRAYSQMDIGISLFDLLQFDLGFHYYQGNSFFRPRQSPIYLVQPYGKHLMIVDYPYKYRFYTKTRQEFVYNLKDDPMEKNNLIRSISSEQLDYFRLNIKYMIAHQQFLANSVLTKN